MNCPWSGWEQASVSFCEERLCAWIREPANTWSNVGYLLIGILLLVKRDGVNRHRRPLGAIALAVGIGSSLFHASATFVGEFLDVGSMFLFATYWWSVLLKRRLAWTEQQRRYRMAIGLSGCLIALAAFHDAGIMIFVGLVVAIMLTEIHIRRWSGSQQSYRDLWALIAAFSVAFTAWVLDIRGRWCDPTNHLFGGHALWHLSNSLCFLFLARHLARIHDQE